MAGGSAVAEAKKATLSLLPSMGTYLVAGETKWLMKRLLNLAVQHKLKSMLVYLNRPSCRLWWFRADS